MAFTGTILWSNSAAKTLYICQANLITSGPVADVMSCGLLDAEYFDGENYRDDFTSSVFIDAEDALATIQTGQSVPTTPFSQATDSANPTTNNLVILTDGTGASAPETQDFYRSATATDAAMHVPPRNEMKKQTLRQFFSGADCTGNLLYELPEDQFRGASTAAFTFIT